MNTYQLIESLLYARLWRCIMNRTVSPLRNTEPQLAANFQKVEDSGSLSLSHLMLSNKVRSRWYRFLCSEEETDFCEWWKVRGQPNSKLSGTEPMLASSYPVSHPEVSLSEGLHPQRTCPKNCSWRRYYLRSPLATFFLTAVSVFWCLLYLRSQVFFEAPLWCGRHLPWCGWRQQPDDSLPMSERLDTYQGQGCGVEPPTEDSGA